ncbi:hypothetical protein DEU56DRAFT_755892 [Suillus clintonianus]|uniref:uncharacterized protein n=1 Tax=Suillus clintonianus TaxID=1904413 RepID=UPI001B873DAA|nr:uncharacterized protein DEU56DRAFT_755892 [Suillus clintonianus]KAG2138326.1 hypothetical protein DEU56DRAFT_755892 [Suillus clintonianus]
MRFSLVLAVAAALTTSVSAAAALTTSVSPAAAVSLGIASVQPAVMMPFVSSLYASTSVVILSAAKVLTGIANAELISRERGFHLGGDIPAPQGGQGEALVGGSKSWLA